MYSKQNKNPNKQKKKPHQKTPTTQKLEFELGHAQTPNKTTKHHFPELP